MLRRTGLTAVLVAIFALLAFQITPAFAHHKDGHDAGGKGAQQATQDSSDHDGDADDSESTAYTEDNDTNDSNTANNVSDDGDNYHPSGKDRSVERGGSGTQGKSESNPDDSKGPRRYEGLLGDDKPNGPGGMDLADQDGNNGCGNDDDFDDDNNGWCGKPRDLDIDDVNGNSFSEICADTSMTTETCDDLVEANSDLVEALGEAICADIMGTAEVECDDDDVTADDVLGVMINRAAPGRVLGSTLTALAAPTTVAGAAVAAAPSGVLPFTGGELIPFAALGMSLIGGGFALARRR